MIGVDEDFFGVSVKSECEWWRWVVMRVDLVMVIVFGRLKRGGGWGCWGDCKVK